MVERAKELPWVVLVEGTNHISAYVHVGTGQGKARRRQLVDVVHVQKGAYKGLADVLEAVARSLRTPVAERSRHGLQGPGAPAGRWGENPNPQP